MISAAISSVPQATLPATRQERLDARDRSRRQRQPQRDACLCDIPDALPVITVAVFVRAAGKTVGHPAGVGADGEGEVERSFGGVNGEGIERDLTRSSTHRHQPGITGDESWLSD